MPRHIHEGTEVGLVCLLKQGKPAGTAVDFVILHDDVEVQTVVGSIVTDERARAGKAATAKYTPTAVPADKTHYVLTYKAKADGEVYLGGLEVHVWPRKGKLTSRNEDDSALLANFLFKVVQNGKTGTDLYKCENDPAVSDFRLEAGAPFTLEAVAPFAFVGDPAAQGSALRDLKSKGKITFKAEFIAPKRPDDGAIKQWVNLAPDVSKKGADGLGNEIEVTVGAEGDRDGGGATKPGDTIGRAGLFVFVRVKFSGPDSRKSKRDTPKTQLAAGLNLSSLVAVKEAATDAEWEYTGKVELAVAGGVGKFKLNLGLAGGDSCEVNIGSTSAANEAKLTFTNWRKIWYELMAPDVMALRDNTAKDGTAVRDFPVAIATPMKTSGDLTFIEYEIYRSQSFTEVEANTTSPGSVLKREFFQRTTGPAKCYLLTDASFKNYPKTFDRTMGARCSYIKACDVNLYNDGPRSDADLVRRLDATTVQADYDLAANDPRILWSPGSAFGNGGGAPAIRSIRWKSKIADPNTYKGPPEHSFEVDVDTPGVDQDKDATFLLDEVIQNPASLSVVFKKPSIGHVATSLDSAAKLAIDGWLAALWTDAKVRPHGFKLKFRVSGELGNDRRAARATSIHDYVASKVNAAPHLYKHPGLAANGALREAALVVNDTVDMGRSHWKLIAMNLPAVNDDDPGKFVGAISTTKCPISVTVTFEPQHSGLGMAGKGAQRGELVLVTVATAPNSVAAIALHELGHQYGLSKVAHGLSGFDPAKGITEDETEVRYQSVGAKGHYYTGRSHSGGHCSYGLTDALKGAPTFSGVRGNKCLMYGSASMNDGALTSCEFCPQCSDYARAQDLSALL